MGTTVTNLGGGCCEAPMLRFAGYGESNETCARPRLLVCMACRQVIASRCRTSSVERCEPCGTSYRLSVLTVAEHGRRVQGGDTLFVTLTAPGAEVHYLPNGEACACTPEGGVNLGHWNAEAGERFNRWVQAVRREWGWQVQYFKGAEVQKRGALHFHLLIAVPKGRGDKVGRIRAQLRELAIHHGFGHALDVQVVSDDKAAKYVSKYVSKSCSERERLPWLDRRTGEFVTGHARYRAWSASRRWGCTMRQVREWQVSWATACRRGEGGVAAGPPALDQKTDHYTSPRHEPATAGLEKPM